jgi:hypothetical protein
MATYIHNREKDDYELKPTPAKPPPARSITKGQIGGATRPTVLGQPGAPIQAGGPRDQYNQRMNELYQMARGMGRGGGRGGGGGRGTFDPGRGAGFQRFEDKSMQYATELMDRESPFGQAATNLRLRDTAQSLDARIQQIRDNFTRIGESGSLAEQKAIQDAQADAEMQRATTVQSMAEAEAQYGLQQSSEVRGWHSQFLQSDTANRQLIMQGKQMSAQAAAASAAASAAREGARMRMMLGIAGAQYAAGESAKRFDMEFDYTANYNRDMMNLQRELASDARAQQNKSDIFGLIGKGIGAIGGLLLGGPAGAAAGAALGGTLTGGGGSNQPQEWA